MREASRAVPGLSRLLARRERRTAVPFDPRTKLCLPGALERARHARARLGGLRRLITVRPDRRFRTAHARARLARLRRLITVRPDRRFETARQRSAPAPPDIAELETGSNTRRSHHPAEQIDRRSKPNRPKTFTDLERTTACRRRHRPRFSSHNRASPRRARNSLTKPPSRAVHVSIASTPNISRRPRTRRWHRRRRASSRVHACPALAARSSRRRPVAPQAQSARAASVDVRIWWSTNSGRPIAHAVV